MIIQPFILGFAGKDVALDPRPIDPDLLKEATRALSLSASDIERASHPAKRKVRLKRNGPESRSRPGFNSRTP